MYILQQILLRDLTICGYPQDERIKFLRNVKNHQSAWSHGLEYCYLQNGILLLRFSLLFRSNLILCFFLFLLFNDTVLCNVEWG